MHERTQRGTLLALRDQEGTNRYPAFQFGADGRPLPALGDVMRTLTRVVETPYTIAAWLTSTEPELDGHSPVDWLRSGRDPTAIVTQAGREAAGLSR